MVLRFGVLTVSDRSARGERLDASGPSIVAVLKSHGWTIAHQTVVPDALAKLSEIMIAWADSGEVDIILTCGGTGFAPSDVTPEATRLVIEREAPGLPEAMRAASAAKSSHAMLSRAAAGIRGEVLIINLPGSPTAAVENLNVVIPALEHAVQLLRADPGAEAGHQKVGV